MLNNISQKSGNGNLGNAGAQRIDALDVAKGIGMLFVVFAHVNYTPELQVLIYSFHMPLFFLLAGMVFRRERYASFGAFLVQRWKGLVIPYLIFSLAPICAVFVLEYIFKFSLGFTKESYIEAVVQIFLAQNSAKVLNTPLWFVPCLLAVEILYFFISKLKRAYAAVVCIILAGLGWLLESGLIGHILLPWSLDSAFFALSFYATGSILAPFMKKSIAEIRAHKYRALICMVILAVCIAIWYPLAVWNGKISLGSKILNNGFLLYLTGVIGTLGILAISILLERTRSLKYLGRNTFCIMGVHYLIKVYMLNVFYELLNIPMYANTVFAETIVPFLIVLALSLVTTAAYNMIKKHLGLFWQKLKAKTAA